MCHILPRNLTKCNYIMCSLGKLHHVFFRKAGNSYELGKFAEAMILTCSRLHLVWGRRGIVVWFCCSNHRPDNDVGLYTTRFRIWLCSQPAIPTTAIGKQCHVSHDCSLGHGLHNPRWFGSVILLCSALFMSFHKCPVYSLWNKTISELRHVP